MVYLEYERIEREIDARILTPYLERNDFSWMGFRTRADGRHPNNWNPWVNSNVLTATLLIEKDKERRVKLIHKVLQCLDNFLVPYPSDGSCDEGPSYWSHAGASLFDNLELLYSATNGRFDVYDDPIIKEIGRFIYRVHIADDYFVSIGDCYARFALYHDIVQNLITPCEIVPIQPGRLILKDTKEPVSMTIRYDPGTLQLQPESTQIDDKRLSDVWGPQIYRLQLTPTIKTAKNTWTLRFYISNG